MFCTACGFALRETDRFCPSCGKPTGPEAATFPPPPGRTAGQRLVRTMNDKKIAGVCGGLAKYFGVDSTIVRFVLLALFLLYGFGLLLYIIGWIIMPRDIDVMPASA
jgi:phage shock protein C